MQNLAFACAKIGSPTSLYRNMRSGNNLLPLLLYPVLAVHATKYFPCFSACSSPVVIVAIVGTCTALI